MNPIDGSTLCLACGLCCNGVLHPHASLAPGESAFAASLGLTVIESEGKPAFQLPCKFLDGCRCTIYAQRRPQVCGNYQCKLLKAYLAGEMPLEAALENIARLRSLWQEVLDNLPTGLSWRELQSTGMPDFNSSLLGSDEFRQAHLDLMMAYLKFNRYTGKHFSNPKK